MEHDQPPKPEPGGPNEYQELDLPAEAVLYRTIRRRIAELGPKTSALRQAEYGDPGAGACIFDRTNRFAVAIEHADAITVLDMFEIGEGIYGVGLNLFSDGAPYVFESDFSGGSGEVTYNLIVTPESGPFMVSTELNGDIDVPDLIRKYLIDAREGKASAPHELSPTDCEQLTAIIASPELDKHVVAD